jgi:hypothetical protein
VFSKHYTCEEKSEVVMTTLKTTAIFSVLTLSSVISWVSVAAAQQRICIVTDSNQYVCGRPATDRDNNNSRRSNQDIYNDINEIYKDVLGRTVDNRNLEIWSRAVRNGRPTRDIRQEVARSPEAQNKINQLYREVLGRDADAAGLRTWTDKLIGGSNLADVRRSLERSDEARNRPR